MATPRRPTLRTDPADYAPRPGDRAELTDAEIRAHIERAVTQDLDSWGHWFEAAEDRAGPRREWAEDAIEQELNRIQAQLAREVTRARGLAYASLGAEPGSEVWQAAREAWAHVLDRFDAIAHEVLAARRAEAIRAYHAWADQVEGEEG